MHIPIEYKNSLRLLRTLFRNISIVCFFLQFFLQPTFENIICNLLALSIFLLTVETVFSIKNNKFADAFIGSIIFFIITSNSLMPVLGTLLDGHAIVYSLFVPVETYLHRFLYGLVLLLAFLFIQNRSTKSLKEVFSRIADKYQLNIFISKRMAWGVGLLSFSLFFFKVLVPLPIEIIKLLDGFGILLYTPFITILPIYKDEKSTKNNNSKLFLYYGVMIILSFFTNSRQPLVTPIATIIGAWLVLFLSGEIILTKKILQKSFLLGVCGVFATGIFSDLSTALLIQRATRDDATFNEKISGTITTFLDKETIDNFLEEQANIEARFAGTSLWQENYLRNPFLARFVQIKYDDNLLFRVASFTESSKEDLRNISYAKILATFPTPILKLFGASIDKIYLNSFTIADYILVLSGNGFLGNFLVGSITGVPYAIFGWWYLPFLLIIYFLSFSIYAGFVSQSFSYKGKENISTLALILAFGLFTTLSVDGLSNLIPDLIRGVWQTMLIYYLAIRFLKGINIK